MSEFTIIQDTREKLAWDFSFYNIPTVIQTLQEGDYTIKELLDLELASGRKILRVERKASTGELAGNLGTKWETFLREIHRLQEYEHKHMIFEFSIDTLMKFPVDSGIPQYKWYRRNKKGKMVKAIRLSGSFMYSQIKRIQNEFNVKVHFSENKQEAMDIAIKIFREVYNANKK